MTQIQLVGITPDALADLIDMRLNKRFKEVEKHLQPKTPTKYLTRQEVAKLLSVDLSTVHNLSVKGILKKYQIGGRVLYIRSEVETEIVKINN
jgi:excisionase family DNA binding protein